MHRLMNLVRVLGTWTILFAICSSTFAQSSPPDYPFVEGEVLVKFAPGLKSAEAVSVLRDAGAVQVKEFRRIGFGLVKLNDMSVEEAIERFKGDPRVSIVQPNFLYSNSDIPDDPSFDYLWGMHNTGQTDGTADADIDAPHAWDLTTGSESVIIAVTEPCPMGAASRSRSSSLRDPCPRASTWPTSLSRAMPPPAQWLPFRLR